MAKRGCKEESVDRNYWLQFKGDREPIKRCPNALVTRRHMRILQLCSLIEFGILPVAGGSLAQTPAFLQAAAIVSEARAEARKDDGKK